jgi:hypothetical protein
VNLLSSSRTDDEISSEVAELVGFDDIELVMALQGERRSAAKDVGTFTSVSPHSYIGYSAALSLLGFEERTRGNSHQPPVVE